MFVTDTHALVWYTTRKTAKLSRKVTAVFEKANTAETVISIPSIVLFEIVGERWRDFPARRLPELVKKIAKEKRIFDRGTDPGNCSLCGRI